MGSSGRHPLRLRAAVAIVAAIASTALAQQAVPPAPQNVVAAKAYAALEKGCAGCHQAGLAAAAPSGSLSNILDLADVASSPWLVRPGVPDASRIYNIALTREGHLDILNDPTVPLLDADDVQSIRDWIGDLTGPDGATCRTAGLADDGRPMDYVAAVLAGLEPESARLTRFVALDHLGGTCGPPTDIVRMQARLEALKGVAEASARKAFTPVDPARMVWRVSLRDIGLSPDAWDSIVGGYGRLRAGEQATWIERLTGTWRPLAPADLFLSSVAGGDVAAAGALVWKRPAPLGRFASEVAMPLDALQARLTAVAPAHLLPARRLLSGATVERRDLDRLADVLVGHGDRLSEEGPPRAPEIALWTDKPSYRAGETVRLSITANRDCHVTLIGVDRAGRATVLFPNEFEPNNRLPKGGVLSVPPADAAYRFRFKEQGRETIVAICSTTHAAPAGIVHDYERLRFTVLGDWQLFLREPPEMREARRDDAATDTPRPNIVQRRRSRGPAVKSAEPIPSADDQVRTAIRIVIE